MAQHKTHTVTATGFARAYILGTYSANGGTVYQLVGSPTTIFEVRETWPVGSTGLTSTPNPIPETWQQQ
jgi:hypothetical protein